MQKFFYFITNMQIFQDSTGTIIRFVSLRANKNLTYRYRYICRIAVLARRFSVKEKTESCTADTWTERAMEASYDEDLSENPFFQVLCREYSQLFDRAVKEGLIICVPRCGSFSKSALVEDDFLSHILSPTGETTSTRFYTLRGEEVKVSNRVLTVEYDIAKPCSSHLLFEETFYTDERSKYSLWCIERPLEQNISVSRDDVLVVTNLREALDFLWTEVYNKNIIKEMTIAIEEFQETNEGLDDEPIHTQRDLVGALYSKNLRMLLQDSRLREKTESNRHYLQMIKIAAETYTLHGLRNFLPRAVSAKTWQEDAILNKTIKNLHDLQLRDLGIRSDIYDGILRGKIELSRINVYSTVLGKIGCLRRSIRCITEGVQSVSSDDILPVLIFLVIRAGLPNWISQLAFMKQFRFSVNSSNEADEAGFLITSLEAAIEHVRSGVLKATMLHEMYNEMENNTQQNSSSNKQRRDTTLSSLFSAIRKSILPEIERILVRETEKTTNDSLSLCHPLCTCESCETRLAGASLSHLPTVNSRDDRGMTAIHVASLYGHVTIVDFLLEHSANPNDADADGTTPLHCAASRGHQNTLLLLLHANADPTIVDSRGNTPLHVAADHGHEGCVKALIYFTEQMGIPMSKSPVNSNGETPLHHAAKWGYGGIVEILMEHGADPRITNRRGQTPLVVAHSSRISKILQDFPKRYATNAIPRLWRAGVLNAKGIVNGDSSSVVESSSKSTEKNHKADRLLAAIAENDLRLACYYLGLEGPVKSPVEDTPKLCHPLCLCERCSSFENSIDDREKIPSLGLNACNERKETSLHVACNHARTEFVQILLDAGASVNLKTIDGRTPLHLACFNGCFKIVKLLINCGNCDINCQDNFGDTPLHLVARNGNARIVQLLIRHGAKTNIKNSRGVVPLEDVEKIHSNDIFMAQAFSNIAKILKNNHSDNFNDERQ